MIHHVSHFIQSWLFPPGLIIVLGLLGFLLWRRWRMAAKTVIIFAFVILWLLSTPIIAWSLIDILQRQYPVLEMDKLSKQNGGAIVVLGGGEAKAPEYDIKEAVSDPTLSRLHYSGYLYDKTHLPIVVSGGNPEGLSHAEADLMQKVLRDDFKIPVNLKESKSNNTAEEAKFLLPILKANKIHYIYLVTHAWHMPRSMRVFNQIFDQADIKIIPAPMGFVTLDTQKGLFNYLPSLGALNTSVIAMHEYIGMVWYQFYYRK